MLVLDCLDAMSLSATSIVGSTAMAQFKILYVICWRRIIWLGKRSTESSSFLVYWMDAPKRGLFHLYGAPFCCLGLVCYNLYSMTGIYPGIDILIHISL